MTRVELGALPEFASVQEEMAEVSQNLQKSWLKLYPARDAMLREIQKAVAWYQADGERKKNLGMFLNNWLSRSRELAAACEAHKEQQARQNVTYHIENQPEETTYARLIKMLQKTGEAK